MKKGRVILVGVSCSMLIGAAGHRGGLVAPYSKMTTLTAEQKDKITLIHQKALEEMRLVKEKEQSDIWAVLGPTQRAEFRAIRDNIPFAATTQPATTQSAKGPVIFISGPASTTQPTVIQTEK